MELNEFVKKTLVELVEGVVAAQGAVAETGAFIVPRLGGWGGSKDIPLRTPDSQIISQVEFDVVLTETQGTGTKAGVGVFFAAIGAGTQGNTNTSDSKLTRIRFQIPIVLPTQK